MLCNIDTLNDALLKDLKRANQLHQTASTIPAYIKVECVVTVVISLIKWTPKCYHVVTPMGIEKWLTISALPEKGLKAEPHMENSVIGGDLHVTGKIKHLRKAGLLP